MEGKRKASPCEGCGETRRCINGLYCMRLSRYVEHVGAKPCES